MQKLTNKLTLYSLQSSYFTAGVICRNAIVVRIPPILKYMAGWSEKRMLEYAQRKVWKIEVLYFVEDDK